VRQRNPSFFLRWGSLAFILLAAIILVLQLVQYSLQRANYPADMSIGGVPVGGLDPQSTAQRLLEVFATPVELHYGEAIIQMEPGLIGFEPNIDSMLAAADIQRTGASFWGGFWNYLWNRISASNAIPLIASYSQERLRAYLITEIISRYDQPPSPAQPVPGTADFIPGTLGQTLDIDQAIILIDTALRSSTSRTVVLTSQRTSSTRPSLTILEILLKQIIEQNGFNGLVDLFFLDLQTAEQIHFGYADRQDFSVSPVDISFTASSTIKIPIMISVYRHFNGILDGTTTNLLANMIERSNNDSSDELMKLMDEVRGPLVVSDTMQELGLQNTFLAGYFYPGAGVLKFYNTPANQRLDINTDPDIYSQTTPSEMGILLQDIYLCAQTGGGALVAAFPGQIVQSSCREMINFLQQDRLGALLQSGVPEGTMVAHKHGWVTDGGVMNHVSDAGIIYTPGGNYVLAIYAYHPVQVIWDEISPLYAELSRAVYNYFNIPIQ
jgi:beta-lactamase class A